MAGSQVTTPEIDSPTGPNRQKLRYRNPYKNYGPQKKSPRLENSPVPYRPPIYNHLESDKNRRKSAKILFFVTFSRILGLSWGLQCSSVL